MNQFDQFIDGPVGTAIRSEQSRPLPSAPQRVEDTGLDTGLLFDLCLKTIYFQGRPSARSLSERMALPFGVVDELLRFLRRQENIEIVGTSGLGEPEYQYALTSKGFNKAAEILEKNQYVGPAPVPFDAYVRMVESQTVQEMTMGLEDVRLALSKLVLDDDTLTRIGTAISSGKSIFIYGDPGNGKSSIAESIGSMLPDAILVPYAFEAYGQIVKVFDPRIHFAVEARAVLDGFDGEFEPPIYHNHRSAGDERWVLTRRPLVITGGELTLAELELRYSPNSKFYIAPLQVKANNGVFVVDDFGRQLLRPEELLNRWMVPMDRTVDHLVFQTGETIEVPFDVSLIFSTNLTPSRLGDEAFFRRIRHKIRIPDPDEASFRQILERMAASTGIPYTDAGADYLLQHHYKNLGRPLRGVHPRDLFALMKDMSKFKRDIPSFTPEWIDLACKSYFLDD